ncbi:F0F1 ATP synthase subunit A [Aquiluna borgnonia]|uniref:ATP synthase subunit a n=1 Tax=Aquiluna borgnonia TaxID=2499157 RepID=A0A7D4Q6P2_9MICO|nr:F0F1 ATP synthase subunit A [Aquiluna borgnonia]QKJ25502.1 F0F1 ATP synthase subunit A [Aquiluna borgnonia]
MKLFSALTLFAAEEGGFHPPSIMEFYPEIVAFEGTIFAINRIMMIRLIVLSVLLVLFWLWTRKFKQAVRTGNVVPGRFQLLGEMALNFVRKNIAHDQLGEKDGDRFLPLLTTIFFMVLGMNITGIIPFANIAGSSVIGLPLVLALAAYVTFIYAGIKRHGIKFFKNSLFPAGVPPAFYVMVTPIEFLSTFILRPVTLALRLLMNMIAGHLLLVLCFSATQFFFFEADGLFKLFGAGTFLFGFAFTLFEILVAVLQAYVFTLLTTVYIQLALADEH